MKKKFALIAPVIFMLALSACSGSAGTAVSTFSQPQAAATPGATAVSGAASAPAAAAENKEVDGAAADFEWDAGAVVTVSLDGDSISAGGAGVTAVGSTATIGAAGTYSLSGVLNDGQIVVDTQDEGVVRLILNGAQISNSSGAAINVVNAERVILILAEGAGNSVSDGANYVFAVEGESEPNAAIFSKSDLSISGSGSLTVNANYNDGIASKDGLLIAGGTITVNAVDDGLRGKDYLVVEGGSLTVSAQGDGLKSDDAEDPTRGYVEITGGALNITAGGNAIQGETDVIVSGGELTLSAGGGSGNQKSADTSTKGISAQVNVNIDAGTFTIDSADDAVHSNGSITVNGGTFAISTGDDGMHADVALTIGGGDIQIAQSYEGLESTRITINAGSVAVNSSDDGINVASGVDGSGGMMGGRPGQMGDTFDANAERLLTINGGTITVNANGDGVDANGAIAMTGGLLVVNGPTQQGNGALDYDSGFMLSGGTVAAAGSSGMAMVPGAYSSENSVMIFFTATQAAGTLVTIQNSAGENILAFAPLKDFQSLAFSSAALVNGETYTISLGGSADGSLLGGYYQDGGASGGTQYASFTVSGVVTTVGTGGGMGGPGGGGGRPRR